MFVSLLGHLILFIGLCDNLVYLEHFCIAEADRIKQIRLWLVHTYGSSAKRLWLSFNIH